MALSAGNAFYLGGSFSEVGKEAVWDPGREKHGAGYLDQAVP